MSLGYSVSIDVGRVQSGETDEIWTPRTPRGGTCGIVLLHGSGASGEYVDGWTQPSSVKLAASLAAAGIPCIAGDFGGQAWGNDAVLSRIDAAWAVLAAKFPTMRTDKICLIGASMGGAAAARYSQLHPAKVACMVGLIPLLDIVGFYNAQSHLAEVATAWGVISPAALPSAANIAATASLAASVPLLAGYSSVDATVLPAWITSYAAAVGGTAIVTDSTYGHSDAAIGGLPIPTVGQFLTKYGA